MNPHVNSGCEFPPSLSFHPVRSYPLFARFRSSAVCSIRLPLRSRTGAARPDGSRGIL